MFRKPAHCSKLIKILKIKSVKYCNLIYLIYYKVLIFSNNNKLDLYKIQKL